MRNSWFANKIFNLISPLGPLCFQHRSQQINQEQRKNIRIYLVTKTNAVVISEKGLSDQINSLLHQNFDLLMQGCHSTDKTLVKNKCSLVLEFPSSTATDDYYCNLVSTKTPGLIRSVQAGKRDQLCHHFIDTLPIDPFNATCQYKGGNTIQIGKNSTR